MRVNQIKITMLLEKNPSQTISQHKNMASHKVKKKTNLIIGIPPYQLVATWGINEASPLVLK
jgi:hypothetical protein